MTTDTRAIMEAYLGALAAGRPAAEIAAMFAPDAKYDVPGDKAVVWWTGSRTGRDDIANFYEEMRAALEPVSFDIEAFLVEGEHAVVIGRLANRVKLTGKLFRSPFSMHAVVRDGMICRYLFLEDGVAALQAARPGVEL